MTVSVNWNGTSYTIPESGETNWSNLTDFLVALGSYAQTTTKQVSGVRVGTTSPVTLTTADYTVVTNLSIAGAVAVTLPTGVLGQVFVITDGRGDAGTNNVTVTGAGVQTINGATHVIDENYGGVILQFNGTTWNVLAGFVGNSPKFTSLIVTGTISAGTVSATNVASTNPFTQSGVNVPTISSASILTNKDIDGLTASNTSRITLPKDTLTNLNLLTRKAGTVVYDTTNSLVKFDNGTSLIAMSGDMVGPASATANAVTRFDSTTGKLVKNSAVTIDDTGALTGTSAAFSSTLAVTGATTLSSTLSVAGAVTLGPSTVASYAPIGHSLYGGTGVYIGDGTATALGSVQLRRNEGSGTTGVELHIRPNTGYKGYLSFTESGVADRWALGIQPSDGTFYFRPGISTTTPVGTISSAGAWTLGPSGSVVLHQANGSVLRLSAPLLSNPQLDIAYNGSTKIGLYYQQSIAAPWLFTSNEALNFSTNSASTNLGFISTTGAWTLGPSAGGVTHIVNGILSISAGAKLKASGAGSTTLSHYEEDNFTPSFSFTTMGTASSAGPVGRYTRIGRVVHFSLYIQVTKGTASGNFSILGLPYTCNSTLDAIVSLRVGNGTVTVPANSSLSCRVTNTSTSVLPLFHGVTNSVLVATDMGAIVDWYVTGVYHV